jgi:hypothetical protein
MITVEAVCRADPVHTIKATGRSESTAGRRYAADAADLGKKLLL